MKKRLAIAALPILAVVVCWAAYILPPLIKQEHFYRGRPTSFWSREIRRWADNPPGWSPAWLDRMLDSIKPSGSPGRPAVLAADESALPVLLDLLHDPDSEVRWCAVRAVVLLASRETIVSALLAAARDDDWRVVSSATIGLHSIGPSGLPVLRRALNDPDPFVRLLALRTLYGQDGDGSVEPMVRLCIETLKDKNVNVRRYAADVLGQLGPQSRAAVPALIEALREETMFHNALPALEKVGPEAVPALAGALKDPDRRVRRGVAFVLGHLGHDARDAVPALLKALKDRDEDVHLEVANALNLIDRRAAAKAGIE